MSNRVALIGIVVENRESINRLNSFCNEYGDYM